MTDGVNISHDPSITTWVESANDGATDFPLQNLPLGVARRRGSSEAFRLATAIGDTVLDLGACAEQHVLAGLDAAILQACREPSLNTLMAMPPERVMALRMALHQVLRGDAPRARQSAAAALLLPASAVEHALPARIGNYTDFFASIHHATRVGALFRPANPLATNYKHLPVAYHGRASTVVVSGTPVRRPYGQLSDGKQAPVFAPARHVDYEMEVGIFVGPGSRLGARVPIDDAPNHVFGYCLLNDWSARDIQWWESQPLGPFLSKSFATTVSPWVVTTAALAPFRAPAVPRGSDPEPLPYLRSDADARRGLLSIELEVALDGEVLGRSNFDTMYWTPAQMLAHHTANGCSLEPGDLIGSGTTSGPAPGSEGCLLERTRNGREPIALRDGRSRTFLEDGDEVVLRGRCRAPGFTSIGFGECRGRIVAAA